MDCFFGFAVGTAASSVGAAKHRGGHSTKGAWCPGGTNGLHVE